MIYVASKTMHGPKWLKLRGAGVPIISSWIDQWQVGATDDWQQLWLACIREAIVAKALIVYREKEELLKGALIEVGAALAYDNPVYAIGCDDLSFINHPMVYRCATLDDALNEVRAIPSIVWRDKK